MSVINKMLRDLDERRVVVAATGTVNPFTHGVHSVKPGGATVPPSAAARWITGVLVLLALIGGGWYYLEEPFMAPVVAIPEVIPAEAVPEERSVSEIHAAAAEEAVSAPTADPDLADVSAAEPLPSSTVKTPTPQEFDARPAPVALPRKPVLQSSSSTDQPAARPPQQVRRVSAAVPAARTSGAASSVSAPATQSEPSATPRASEASAKQPASEMPEPVVQRQLAARETLAQAQSLWRSGAREAAVNLLRKAISQAEREQSNAEEKAGSQSILPPMVRELARMELAEGRGDRMLALLTQLEPVLASHADLWALRGNLAQRLGRYEASSQAYLAALEMRPEEPRWLLGAAVSYAAQGELARARELAERAKQSGTISPEVLAYLRQAGVKLR